MLIGIGTQNPAKIEAVKLAFKQLRQTFPKAFKGELVYHTLVTQTSVPDMPLSQSELMQGALERALFVYEKIKQCRFAIGMEGGVFRDSSERYAFLQSWVYVYDGNVGFYGASPALPLPDKIVQPLYGQGEELNSVIDRLSGKSDVRSKEGTFGILTRDMITRSQSFILALIAATSPFFNEKFY